MRSDYFLNLAKKESFKSDHHSHRIGAVITRKNKVIGRGFNLLKTHPKSPHPFRSMHAEFLAAISANYDLNGATIYIFRQHKNGNPAIAKPCQSCYNFLVSLGVKRIVYSFNGHFIQENVT